MLTKHFFAYILCSVIELQKPVGPATGGVPAGTPFYTFGGIMPKPFLCYEDQIEKLVNEKGLVISDAKYATDMLKRIGYFGLISGYKFPFKNPTTKKYIDGIRFEDIVALYKFDENLRELFLKYILQVERHVRSLLSYYFTEKYGEQQIHYMNPANYRTEPRFQQDVNRLISMLTKLATTNTDYPYINHQRNTYGNVPLWVLMNGVTFGTLSKFYSLVTPDLKAKVSKNFIGVNEKQLEQFLSVMTKFRNVCAHNERLFTYRTMNDIPDTPLHKKLGIHQKGTTYINGKNDLFSVVIAFRYLLPNEEFRKFKTSLAKIIRHYTGNTTALTEEEVLSYMGFPACWATISRYSR